jgi:hypothetical protein
MLLSEIGGSSVRRIDMTPLRRKFTPNLEKLIKLIEHFGFKIRIVGGAVRDILLGRAPRDIDLITDALPDAVMYILGKYDVHYITKGIPHGTVKVKFPGDEEYEITSLGYEVQDECCPQSVVIHSGQSWEGDAQRRDFTIDTMSVDLDGLLYDYLGGMADLRNQFVRFIGSPLERIQKDPILIMRFFRLLSLFRDPKFDKSVLPILREKMKLVKKIKPKRLDLELDNIRKNPSADRVLKMMSNLGFDAVIGEIKAKAAARAEKSEKVDEARAPVTNPYFVTLYRGDSDAIQQYDVGRTDPLALFGQGIYLTDNKRVAGDYKSKGNQDQSVIWRFSGRNATKQDAIDRYIRMQGKYLDYDGNPLSFGQQRDYGMVTVDANGVHHPHPNDVKRIAAAHAMWQKMAPTIDVRKNLDGSIVFQKKQARAVISVFRIPVRLIQKMIDAEAPVDDNLLYLVNHYLNKYNDRATARDIDAFVRNQEFEEGSRPSFRMIFTNIGPDSPLRDGEVQEEMRMELLQDGHPGIVYQGGVTMGGGYKHKAYVFWDSNTINKYRVS